MRRPTFPRWIRLQVLDLAETQSFNLRRFAAIVQKTHDAQFASALLLHAHENGQFNRLMSYIYDEDTEREYRMVEQRLGGRSVERLALRGTPMMSLPKPYRDFMTSFAEAYYAPERIEEEKRALWEAARESMLVSGSSPAEIARALGLDSSNLSAYLANGDTGRFTLDTARAIAEYLAQPA